MDTRTGDIYVGKTLAEALKDQNIAPFLKPINLTPIMIQKLKKPVNPDAIGRIGRNDPCPCGSGNKFKKCCLKQSSIVNRKS